MDVDAQPNAWWSPSLYAILPLVRGDATSRSLDPSPSNMPNMAISSVVIFSSAGVCAS